MALSSVRIIFIVLLLEESIGNESEIGIRCFQAIPSSTQLEAQRINADCSKEMLHDVINVFSWANENITSLDLSNNYIEKIPRFPVFDRLDKLNFKDNSIKIIEERAFSNLRNLEVLDLSFNLLTGFTLRADILRGNFSSNLYEPLRIKVLLLSYNRITSLNDNTFEHLPFLQELRLNGNLLKSADLAFASNFLQVINSVFSLKVLDLAKTGISSLACQHLKHLRLEKLFINGNKMTEVPKNLYFLHSLKFIDINENPISELNSSSFLGMVNLNEIVASGMPNLTSIRAGTFSHLTQLQTLKCSYNPNLSYIDEQAFSTKSLYGIKNVFLNNNKFHSLPKNLLRWSQLETLELGGNPWSCDCETQWLIDFDKHNNQSLIRFNELVCSEPEWLNGTSFEILSHPIGKLICDESTGVKHEVVVFKSASDIFVLLVFTALIFFILGMVFLYYNMLALPKTSLLTNDSRMSGGQENNVKYIKLKEIRIH